MGEQKVSIGRIVHYTLSAQDASEINRRRTNSTSIGDRIAEDKWPLGAQAHIGNLVEEGKTYPMIVVRDNGGTVNGQVFLDGNDTFWATSRGEGTLPGTWAWPARG